MSSKTYQNNLKRNILPSEEEPAAEEKQAFVPEVKIEPTSAPARVATEAFAMPVLPGMNKGYDVRVSSSQDDKDKKIRLFTASLASTGALPDAKWRKPTTDFFLTQAREDEDVENPPLKVRMSFLPSPAPEAVASAKGKSPVEKGHDLLRRMAADQMKKTPEEAAACAALDAYKKQQIEAIQKDRETLTALRTAIHSLGLDKELDFMTEKGSALSTSANQAPVSLDAPAQTAVR